MGKTNPTVNDAMDTSFLAQETGGMPLWGLGLAALLFFLIRPAMIVFLPDEMCGPGGWLIDTDNGGWFVGGDGDGDGGDGGGD